MDKSEQYIKMCESSKEIQKSWQPNVGDWFLNDYRGTTGFQKMLKNKYGEKIKLNGRKFNV